MASQFDSNAFGVPRAFLAGRISEPDDWRDWRVALTGHEAITAARDPFDAKTVYCWDFRYCGPFGDATNMDAASRRRLYEANRARLESADFLFAFIDGPDCHETLAQIGYAIALGLPTYVHLGLAAQALEIELQFLDDCATRVTHAIEGRRRMTPAQSFCLPMIAWDESARMTGRFDSGEEDEEW